jgi:hypothetical protein
MDVLFENKVSARKFRKTRVDQFAGHNTDLAYGDAGDSSSDNEKKAMPSHVDAVH